MLFTLKKAYAIWSLWILVMTLVTVVVMLTQAVMSGDDFTKEYYFENVGWLQESLLVIGVLAIPTSWWPLLGTRTRQSGNFFVISLVISSVLLFFSTLIVNGMMWLLSGASYDPNATDAGLGAAAFLLTVYIPSILIAYLVVGLLVRYKSRKAV